MGNEMGNNNTSGIQVEVPEKSMQEGGHADDVIGKNPVIPPGESDEKIANSGSDDPKVEGIHVDDQELVGRDEESEVHPPCTIDVPDCDVHLPTITALSHQQLEISDSDAPTMPTDQREAESDPPSISEAVDVPQISLVEVVPTNESSEVEDDVKDRDREISPAENKEFNEEAQQTESDGGNVDLKDCKELSLENNVMEVKGFLFEDQILINSAEEEETTAPKPPKSEDLESDQHESPQILVEPSLPISSESPQRSNNTMITSSAWQEQKLASQETIPLDFPNNDLRNYNEDLSTKMNSSRNDSLESLPEEKCIILTQETKLVAKESKTEEIKNEHSQAEAIVAQTDIDTETETETMKQFDEIASLTIHSTDNAETFIEPILELKQESDSEFIADNSFPSAGILVTKPARELPPLSVRPSIPPNQANAQCAKDETSRFSCASSGSQSLGRSSTESNSESMSNHPQMRKSPSFNLDLLTESRKEETELTPNPNVQETSDSEKLKTPFLGFLKDEEETSIVIAPNAEETPIDCPKKATQIASIPSKAKSKRKARPFLFGTCICCAAVIN